MNLRNKRIVVSVISDLVSDQRVAKICDYLQSRGAIVSLIGRSGKDSPPLNPRTYTTRRLPSIFRKGALQYLEFNLRLLFRLCFEKADLFLANDLDTLTPNYLHAFMRRKPLVYDSHEYFTGVPELRDKSFKRKIWLALERLLLPRIKHAYTVNQSVADRYAKETGISMKVVRNLPRGGSLPPCEDRYKLPEGRRILLMQGSGINPERGYEEAVLSMQFLPENYLLVIIGGGSIWKDLKQLVLKENLSSKVLFIEKVPFEILSCYTRQANLGLSLDKPLSDNYRLSLPNKVFDYFRAGVPVLASRINEVEKLILQYKCGWILSTHDPGKIAATIETIFSNSDAYAQCRQNTNRASAELNWEQEEIVLDQVYRSIEFKR